MEKVFITTPIYYVNDSPHIGSSYTTLNADILARFYRLKLGQNNVFFLTGTDEHGLKIKQAAEAQKITPQEFVDKISSTFISSWKELSISNDYFIRTTNEDHKKNVADFLIKIKENGFIYEDVYEGLYCVGCEKFLSEEDLCDGKCSLHPNTALTNYKEKNWFFKLSSFQDKLLKLIETDKYLIAPSSRKNEVVSKIKQGLKDISISRNGLSWGIPVPWDEKQSIYVWVDALINYHSALKINKKLDFWPPSVHFIAKDILWFHSVIWPALLLAAGFETPKSLFCHGYFTISGQKMSKSLGNIIRSSDLISKYGVDATRFLIAQACQFGDDGDVSWEKFDIDYNAKLANGIGNLISRVARLASNESFSFPNTTESNDLSELDQYFSKFEIDKALLFVVSRFESLNNYLDENKPWELIKNNDLKSAQEVLSHLVAEIRINTPFLIPFMPGVAEKIINHFKNEKVLPIAPIFPRI